MGVQDLQLTCSSGGWIQRIPRLSTSLYNQRRVSVVTQAAFCVFGNYYRCTSNKAARGVSGSCVRHRGDEWANWGLTVNNWRRWDECWAPLCASSCSDSSFFLVLLNPATLFVFCLPGFSSFLFSHSVGSPSLSPLLSPSSPAFILSPADSHQPVLVANAELSGCDNTLRCSSCHRFIELLK